MITWRAQIFLTRITRSWRIRSGYSPAFGSVMKSVNHVVLSAASACISGISGPAIAKFPTAPDEPDWFFRNFGQVGNREAAEAAENAEAADEQQLVLSRRRER